MKSEMFEVTTSTEAPTDGKQDLKRTLYVKVDLRKRTLIPDVRKAAQELQTAIDELIHAFEQSTSLPVTWLDLEQSKAVNGRSHCCRVKVEV